MKVCLVASPGGHLYQTYLLKSWWEKATRFWVGLRSPDTEYLLKNEKVYFAFGPENRSLINLIRNIFVALKVLLKEKPDVIFSTGAGVAVPFFWVGRLLNVKTVYLEPYDFILEPSLTAKLVAPVVTVMLVQHRALLKKISRSQYWGSII